MDTFDKDIKESKEFLQQVGLVAGGLGMFTEEALYDILLHKFNNRNWFIIFIPFTANDLRIEEKIENMFYPPKTHKNAGFEIIPLLDKLTTIIFCHKKYMSLKQLQAVLAQVVSPVPELPKGKDVIVLKIFGNKESQYWIEKLETEIDKMQSRANNLHRPESIVFEIKTKNPEVLRDVNIYSEMRKVYDNMWDHIMKQKSGE